MHYSQLVYINNIIILILTRAVGIIKDDRNILILLLRNLEFKLM